MSLLSKIKCIIQNEKSHALILRDLSAKYSEEYSYYDGMVDQCTIILGQLTMSGLEDKNEK